MTRHNSSRWRRQLRRNLGSFVLLSKSLPSLVVAAVRLTSLSQRHRRCAGEVLADAEAETRSRAGGGLNAPVEEILRLDG
jgi:hypothetical protein